ncbi:MAG: cytochrome c [Bacteroidota bacterium]
MNQIESWIKFFCSFALCTLLLSCGRKKEEEKKDGFEVSRTKKEDKKAEARDGVPVDLSNKGIGPIKEVIFTDEIDTEMAVRGEAQFNAVCVACHMVDQRMIGPPMKGVYERRSPEWVMNMILNPNGMLREDPIAKALLKEYNNAIMLNQNLSEEEARDLAEYFRTL